MIIIIHGEDTFRSGKKLKELVNQYKAQKSGANFLALEGGGEEKEDFARLEEFLKSESMFEEEKLLVLKNFLARQKKESFTLVEQYADNSKVVVLLYEGGKRKENQLPPGSQVLYFPLLRGRKLGEWLLQEAKEMKGDVDLELAQYLIRNITPDLIDQTPRTKKIESEIKDEDKTRLLYNELKKLLAFNVKPTKDDADKIVNKISEENIFELIDLLISEKKEKSLRMLREKTEAGEDPLKIFNLVSRQIRNLIMVKEMTVGGRKLPLHPYVIKKSAAQAERFSSENLKNAYKFILDLEIKIKTGLISPVMALESFVYSF